MATRLAAADPVLAARLAPRPGSWEAEGATLTSPGWRRARLGPYYEVGARLPERADGEVAIGIGQSPDFTLRLTPEGAAPTPVTEDEGRASYLAAYRDTDVVWVATTERVEWFYLLHTPAAPTELVFRVTLPEQLPEVRPAPSGGLAFLDAGGNQHLYMPRPFALDAAGTRRDAEVTLDAGRLRVRLDPTGLQFPVLLDPAIEKGVWLQVASTGPAARSGHALAYDSARQRTVLFGGNLLGDTWEWNGSAWSQRATTGPVARTYHSMVYDSARQRTVLFGGVRAGALKCGDTWEWNGTSWVQSAAGLITPRQYQAMAYDSGRSRTVLFGGADNTNAYLGDTWERVGTTWSKVATTGPTARVRAAMAYDSARARTVLFGGVDATGYQGDTWEWNGSSWTRVATTGATARINHAMAYDSARARTVLFGGLSSGGSYLTATSEWSGSSWRTLATTGPGGRLWPALAFDSGRGRMVLFGGKSSTTDLGDTWEYHTRGAACTANAQCETGHCVDGVCCETASCGVCQACNLADPGVCTAVTNAPDPDTCTGTKACGPTGVCNVANGQPCTPGVTACTSFNCVDGYCCDSACAGGCNACDGASRGWSGAANGHCAIAPAGFAGVPTCTPYLCDGISAACLTACTTDGNCIATSYCAADGTCQPRKSQGTTCDAAAGADCKVAGCRVCTTGFCRDQRCCDEACATTCRTCAATPGTCTTVRNADDPDTCAAATSTCDGDGSCKLKTGQICSQGTQCATTSCADGRCCESACAGGCDVCDATPGSCTVVAPGSPGANPACAPYLCGGAAACPTTCAADADCVADFYCAADATCQPRKAPAAACDAAAGADCREAGCRVCASAGGCVDGFCCDTACAGACDVCAAALGASADGTCGSAPAGYPGNPPCGAYACTGLAPTCTGTLCNSDLYCGPDYYCAGGGSCQPRRAQGETCSQLGAPQGDCLVAGCRVCTTGFCVDGVCCADACDAACKSCVAGAGTCTGDVAQNHEDLSPTAVCTGTSRCDGAGGCKNAPGQPCAAAADCASGYCVDGICCQTECQTPCWACNLGTPGTCLPLPLGQADVDPPGACVAPSACDGAGTCRQATGQPCTDPTDCASLVCADGVCCASECASACMTCDLAGAAGTCVNVPQRQSDPGTCEAPDACDGAGTCKKGDGAACQDDGECAGGHCVDGFCCESACAAVCLTCGRPGTEGQCVAVPLAGTDVGCDGTHACDGTGTCRSVGGQDCGEAGDCTSGHCVDGKCCDTTCLAPCHACNLLGSEGTCSLIPVNGTDEFPVNACTGGSRCDGAGACKKLRGQACTSADECMSGACADGFCCDEECLGECRACDLSGNAGTCGNVPRGQFDTTCLEGSVCDGAGHCRLAEGQGCGDGAACLSGYCVDGVCCNSACGAKCLTCVTGTCGPVGYGENPDDECGSGACGGFCNGAGACAYPTGTTPCAEASCSGAVLTPAATCDGTGSCAAATPQACAGGYVCNQAGTACLTACTVAADCQAGYYCETASGTCKGVSPDGTPCARDGECASGHCLEQICCAAASCQGFSCASGSCRTDCARDDHCQQGWTCDVLAGECLGPAGAACLADAACQSGACAGGHCCAGACAHADATCGGACDSAGACTYPSPETVCSCPGGGTGRCQLGACACERADGGLDAAAPPDAGRGAPSSGGCAVGRGAAGGGLGLGVLLLGLVLGRRRARAPRRGGGAARRHRGGRGGGPGGHPGTAR